jgi:hypothetical protein
MDRAFESPRIAWTAHFACGKTRKGVAYVARGRAELPDAPACDCVMPHPLRGFTVGNQVFEKVAENEFAAIPTGDSESHPARDVLQ